MNKWFANISVNMKLVQQFVDWLATEQAQSGDLLTGRPLPSIAV